ncbi:MAG: hypothetical protein H5T72_05775 [Actinobacteria bacterium]|nr:hypothetical protein [Actinomycetota bacterium]
MKRKTCLYPLLAACLFFCLFLDCSSALADGLEVVGSGTLLREWEKYDGREVVFRGEAVGDVMVRGGYAWVAVNDDHYSLNALHETGELRGGNSGIGIWLPASEAEKITRLGRHGSVGDYVEVVGVFHADCREHGGDFDIHARSLTVLEPGRELHQAPGAGKWPAALASLAFLGISLIPLLKRRAQEKRSARSLLRRSGWD